MMHRTHTETPTMAKLQQPTTAIGLVPVEERSPDVVQTTIRLGEVLDLLPFNHSGAERVRAGIADNLVRTLRVPTGEAEG
jgi:hypothetical protein